jgi:hypothetical protein
MKIIIIVIVMKIIMKRNNVKKWEKIIMKWKNNEK